MSALPKPTDWAIRNLAPIPGANADSPQRVRWIRERIRSYVLFLACLDIAGVADDWLSESTAGKASLEALMAGTGTAHQAGLPFADGVAAGRAEWAHAQTNARAYVDELRRVIVPLARAREPGDKILAAARALNDRHNYVLPGELLNEAVRVIARSVPPYQSGRRHGVR